MLQVIICAPTASELDAVENEIHEISSTVRVRKCTIDIVDEESVISLAETVQEEECRLDVLINNAGVTSPWVPIAEGDTISYMQTFNVNLNGTYLMLKFFLPLLVETAKKEKTVVDVVNMVRRFRPGTIMLSDPSPWSTS